MMTDSLKLMCVLAHPDDESLGIGGTLAKYAAEGVEIYLVTATRGERGWFGANEDYPGPDALGEIREGELRKAAQQLGIQEVRLLNYVDGELDDANPQDVIDTITGQIRSVRPDVVITFDPYGSYGHPDHIAICQFTTAAIVQAANSKYNSDHKPHVVSKLYYGAPTHEELEIYQQAFGELVMSIDGVERRAEGWPEWAITTRIDTEAYWQQAWQAVACHRTQLPGYESLQRLSEEKQRMLWREETYYRVFSLVNGGREMETNLFEGL